MASKLGKISKNKNKISERIRKSLKSYLEDRKVSCPTCGHEHEAVAETACSFAARLGLHRQTIYGFLKGKPCTSDLLDLLADFLDQEGIKW